MLKTRLADGSIDSFEEYRYIAGQLRGMAYIEEEIKTAMKGVMLEDD